MKHLKYIMALLLLTACKMEQKDVVKDFPMEEALNLKSQRDSMTNFPKNWKNIEDVYGSWVGLERDSIGYLVYDRCDGNTPTIEVNESTLKYIGVHEPTFYKIKEKYIISKDELIIIAKGGGTNHAKFSFKIIDYEKKLVLHTTDIDRGQNGNNSHKIVVTMKNLIGEFRVVENPCPTHRIPEIKFLPVEF